MKKLRFNNMKQFSQDSSFVDPGFKFRSFPPKQTLCTTLQGDTMQRLILFGVKNKASGLPFNLSSLLVYLPTVWWWEASQAAAEVQEGQQCWSWEKSDQLEAVHEKWTSGSKPEQQSHLSGADWTIHRQCSKKHWWGIPPHSLQSHDQEHDVACRILSDASYSLEKWLKPAQQRHDGDSWQPQSPMAAQRRMTMPGFCYVFLIFFFYEGTGGRWRHMTRTVISTGWISKTISLRTDKLKELRAFHCKKILCFAEYLTKYF